MIMKVYETLSNLNLPLAFLKRHEFGKEGLSISYHFFNDSYQLYGDGKPNQAGGALQVDVFSNGVDYTSTVNEVKALLTGANFMYANGNDDIENLQGSEQIYHKVLIFNYVESEVKDGNN